jgi:hypothetical protein
MPRGEQQTSGEEHKDASASLMSLARLLARQAAAELSAAAGAPDAPSSPASTEEEISCAENKD